MRRLDVFIIFFLFCFLIEFKITPADYLGGSFNWYCVSCRNGANLIRFTYRMTWEKGTGPCGPNCSPHDVNKTGTVPAPLQSLTWNCTSGCGASKKIYADVNYIVTSVSYNSSGWEQGEFFFITRDLKGTGPFEVSIEGIKWMVSPDKVNGGGRMVTTLDLGVRNDSRNPNASPIAGVQPSVGIQFGCTSEVPFAIVDPDADTIRCRLATDQECGDSCTNLPNFHLDKEKCSLTITATASNGFVPEHDYRLTVMLEDYPDYTISMGKEIRSIRRPMSKIPLQLTIRTITDMKPCNSKRGHFENVYPNFNDYHRVPYPGPFVGVFKSRIFMQAQDINNTEIMLSIPANMRSDLLPDDRNHTGIPVRSDVVQEYFRMIPNRRQIADTILCSWGRSPNGITDGQLCYVPVLFDVDNCPPSNPCQHNGTCMDLYRRYTCKCPHGYKPLDCSHKVTCADFPCKNNGTCVDTGTMYICVCPKGFTGLDCETKLHIKCYMFYNSCPHTWIYCSQRGQNCGLSKCQQPQLGMTLWKYVSCKNSNVLPIVLGVITGAGIVAMTTACCCWWFLLAGKRPRSRERKVKPKKLPENGLDTL